MANAEHLAILKEGVEVWNEWRELNPKIKPDLSRVYFVEFIPPIIISWPMLEESLNEIEVKQSGDSLFIDTPTFPRFRYTGDDLERVKLGQEGLRDFNFYKCNLKGSFFDKVDLSNANFISAEISGGRFKYSNLTRANFQKTKLTNVKFDNSKIHETCFTRATLNNADLSGIHIASSDLSLANLTGAILRRSIIESSNLQKVNFSGANLRKAKFREVNCSGANFKDVKFNEANLRGTDFQGANFDMTDFTNADMRNLNLNGANLIRAKLQKLNLRGANLNKADLSEANLREANLREAILTGAILRDAKLNGVAFQRAKLNKANLHGADLKGANLSGANLNEANLNKANLSKVNLEECKLRKASFLGANMSSSNLIHADLAGADISNSLIFGINVWDISKKSLIQKNLRITPMKEPEITVDDLEIAQFIYLLLKNLKFRQVIEAITSKAVLILGRFTSERKKVLDAIRNELRNHNFLPILFDFEKPATRDLTETISILAKLSRFVIADLTDAKSIPQELSHIVPNMPSLPVIPLILKGQREYGMFEHWPRYPWVLPIYEYENEGHLISTLSAGVIEPAERKVQEIRNK